MIVTNMIVFDKITLLKDVLKCQQKFMIKYLDRNVDILYKVFVPEVMYGTNGMKKEIRKQFRNNSF